MGHACRAHATMLGLAFDRHASLTSFTFCVIVDAGFVCECAFLAEDGHASAFNFLLCVCVCSNWRLTLPMPMIRRTYELNTQQCEQEQAQLHWLCGSLWSVRFDLDSMHTSMDMCIPEFCYRCGHRGGCRIAQLMCYIIIDTMHVVMDATASLPQFNLYIRCLIGQSPRQTTASHQLASYLLVLRPTHVCRATKGPFHYHTLHHSNCPRQFQQNSHIAKNSRFQRKIGLPP